MEKYVQIQILINIVMPSEDTMLEFNQYQKSDKTQFIIYVGLEFLIEKIEGKIIILKINLQQKQVKNILSVFSMSTISSFKDKEENKNNAYRGNEKVLSIF